MIKEKNTTIGYHCPQCGISILNTVNMFSFSSAGSNLIKLKCPCGASELTVHITKDKKFRLTVPCIVCPNAHSYTISPGIFFERDLFSFSCKFTALNICFIGKNQNSVMEAMRKNEQELLETFAEYDDNFDSSDIKELGDIFDWDEEDFDDDELFEELFGNLDDAEDADIEEFLGINKAPGFELYKNDDFNYEEDGDLDMAIYSDFKTYTSAGFKKPENKKEAFEIALDSDADASKLKIKNYPIVMQILGTLSKLVQNNRIYCKCGNFDGSLSLLDNHVHIECKICGSERDIKSSGSADIEYIAEIGELFLDYED